MEIKGLVICLSFLLLLFGISLPQGKRVFKKKCNSCTVILTKQDSIKITTEIKQKVDSFVAEKKDELKEIADSIKKIEKKLP